MDVRHGTQFSVSLDVFDQFPDYIVGWVIARGLTHAGGQVEISGILTQAEERAQLIHSNMDLKDEPAIAEWRTRFSALGWSPSKYPASVEAIVKRVARGGTLPRVHPAVDLANAGALLYLVPVGCHDLARSTNLEIRKTRDGDQFLPMGDSDAEIPMAGEIVYTSEHSVRTRRWVWRQSREALVSSDASTILFPIDGFEGFTGSRVEAATEFISTMCRQYLTPEVETGLIDRDHPSLY